MFAKDDIVANKGQLFKVSLATLLRQLVKYKADYIFKYMYTVIFNKK